MPNWEDVAEQEYADLTAEVARLRRIEQAAGALYNAQIECGWNPDYTAEHDALAAALAERKESEPPRQIAVIRYANGEVDDVAISCDLLRLAQMDTTHWWVCVYRGEQRTSFDLYWDRKRREIVATVREDTIGCRDDTVERKDEQPCPDCDGDGTVDVGLDSTMGRPYCHCEAGRQAEQADWGLLHKAERKEGSE